MAEENQKKQPSKLGTFIEFVGLMILFVVLFVSVKELRGKKRKK